MSEENTSEPEAFHPLLGREVPVGMIDRELRRMGAEDVTRTKASLINLAIYSEAPGSLERNSETVRELTREHACRAVIIYIDRAEEKPTIHAWINIHCHLKEGKKTVCCEQIAVALTGRVTGRMRNTVLGHLSSDLPLTMWWQGELSPVFGDRFYRLVDRFIMDSSEWANPLTGFAPIVKSMADAPEMVIHDLEWARTYQFRLSVATIFDEPLAQAMLPRLDFLRIRHGSGHRIAALLLVSWIATQAGWRKDLEVNRDAATGELELVMRGADGRAIRALLEGEAGAAPVSLLEIGHGEKVVIRVSRLSGEGRLRQELDVPGRARHVSGPAGPEGSPQLVAELLSRGGRNSLYHKIFPRFLDMLARVLAADGDG